MSEDGLAVAKAGQEVVEGDPFGLSVKAEDIGLIRHILVLQVGKEGVEHGEVESGKESSAVDIQFQWWGIASIADVLVGKSGADGDMFEQVVSELGRNINLDHGAELNAEATTGKQAFSEGELGAVYFVTDLLSLGLERNKQAGQAKKQAEVTGVDFQHI